MQITYSADNLKYFVNSYLRRTRTSTIIIIMFVLSENVVEIHGNERVLKKKHVPMCVPNTYGNNNNNIKY